MMSDFPSVLAWAVGIFLLYALLSRGLFRATEEARQSLVDLAGSLIDSPKTSEVTKEVIRSMLDDAHSARSAWILALFALTIVFRLPFIKRAREENYDVPNHLRATYDSFNYRWIAATVGNSLAAAIVFAFGMFLAISIRLSLRSFAHALTTKHEGDGHGRGAPA